MSSAAAPLGLRERKNRERRRAIVRATAELTIAGGYASATIPRIAERADVSPRTVSAWFPHKDDIFFEDIEVHIARATRHLGGGPGDVIDRIQAWFAEEGRRELPDPEISRLRRAAIEHDPELRARDRQHYEQIESEIARAVAHDTGAAPEDMGPQLFAGAAMAFLRKLGSMTLEPRDATKDARVAVGFAFLRAGLASLAP
jgi:AcrR family transcriptional regulator